MNTGIRRLFSILTMLAMMLGLAATPHSASAVGSTVLIDNLQPSWTAPGGGGVYAAYYGPPAYAGVSPGTTDVFDGRGAGIIKAGINVDADTHYWDEGLFAWAPTFTINTLAAGVLNYDVENEKGDNAVWMTIEIDTGVVTDRNDNTVFQHVPVFYGSGWHTVDAAAGTWQKWNDDNGDVTGSPFVTLDDIAADVLYDGLNVVRMYLRLGMGDAYNTPDDGTVGWVDKVVIGEDTYDFVVPTTTVVTPASTDWVFYNDNGQPGFTTGYHSGPGTPPAGDGSAFITLSSASAGVTLVTQKYAGTPLDEIQELSYSTYSTGPTTALSFQINYDPDLTDANIPWYGRLVYEPYLNGTVVPGTWQTWDMIDGGAGLWYASSNGASTVDEACPMAAPCTWTALLAAFPNIGIRGDSMTGIQFKAGSGWASFNGSVDNFSIQSINGAAKFDFEPASPVYVDDSWVGTTLGTDPDAGGPAVNFGADSFATIQEGVDGVVTGGTVNVAAGTYAGNIVINKSVELIGDPGDGAAGPGASAPLIDGGSTPGSGFFIDNGVSNVTIQGFEIANFTSNDTGIGNGISAWETSTSYITIQDNDFHDLGWNAVLVGNDGAVGNHTYWTIQDNIVTNSLAYGIELTNASNSVVQDNIIHTNGSGTGILIVARRNESNISILDNQIDGSIAAYVDGGRAGIYVIGWGFEVTGANLDSITITGNTVATTGLQPGIWLRDRDTGTITNAVLHTNSINTLVADVASAVDAEMNWWGTVVEATIAAQITGTGDANVDYTPWCTDDSCTAFVPPYPTNVTVSTLPEPSHRGVTTTITVNVANTITGGPVPAGTVDVGYPGLNPIPACNDLALVSGSASCSYVFPDGSSYLLTAAFTPTDSATFEADTGSQAHKVWAPPTDFEDDDNTDPAKFDAVTGIMSWLDLNSSTWHDVNMGVGITSYVPRSDFDGDGKTDPAEFISGSNSLWYLQSSTDTWEGFYMGPGTFTLQAGSDLDGDGRTDPARFDSTSNALWFLKSTTGLWDGVYMGPGTYQVLNGSDYDGDGITDPALFVSTGGANALWYLPSSTGTWQGVYMGPGTYEMVEASDFDGDNKTDPALFISSSNALYYLESSTSTWQALYMGPGTIEYVDAADFDGDNMTDPAEFVPSTGVLWWFESSSSTWQGVPMGAGTYDIVN